MIVMFASACHPVSAFARYERFRRHAETIGYHAPTGRDHCPADLSVSDGMEPDAGGACTAAPVAPAADDDDGSDDPDPARRRPPPQPRPLHQRATLRAATGTGGASNPSPLSDSLLLLSAVLERVPVGRVTWLRGVRDGRFPQPVRLSPRRMAWRASDIETFIRSL